MRIKREERPPSRLESFTLTDIVMNILIFFLIAFGLLYTFGEKLTKVELPEASRKEKTSGILISITKEGKVFLNEKEITTISEDDDSPFTPIGKLSDELKEQMSQTTQRRVVIRADKNLPYKKVEKVANSVLAAGESVVNLAVLEESD